MRHYPCSQFPLCSFSKAVEWRLAPLKLSTHIDIHVGVTPRTEFLESGGPKKETQEEKYLRCKNEMISGKKQQQIPVMLSVGTIHSIIEFH